MKTERNARKYRGIYFALTIALFLVMAVSFMCGRYNLRLAALPRILLHELFPSIPKTWSKVEAAVVLDFRLPRIIAAVFVGAALSMSGATYQIVFSNPVASPDTLGVSSGAAFGAVIGMLSGIGAFAIKISAFFAGCIGVILVHVLTYAIGRDKRNITYLLLTGMIISSVFSGLLSVLKYVADPDSQLPQITYWLMGSFSNVRQPDLGYYLLFFFVGAMPLVLLRWRVNLLELDYQEAKTMGINVVVLRTTVIACATLLTAASTAITGGISWVGLFIPHIARALVGSDYRRVLPVSALLGGIFLLSMDNLARTISVNELPISIMTSLIGAPVFFAIIAKRKKAL